MQAALALHACLLCIQHQLARGALPVCEIDGDRTAADGNRFVAAEERAHELADVQAQLGVKTTAQTAAFQGQACAAAGAAHPVGQRIPLALELGVAAQGPFDMGMWGHAGPQLFQSDALGVQIEACRGRRWPTIEREASVQTPRGQLGTLQRQLQQTLVQSGVRMHGRQRGKA